jgi:hypothetical protein
MGSHWTRDNGSKPRSESGFVTHVTFSGHFRCPLERREGIAETEETAETCS